MWPTFAELLPLILFEIASALFFVMFFQCWVQMRFEKAFGAIPAIIITGALFSLHHIGYSGYVAYVPKMWTLFFNGMVSAIVFRLTRNMLISWPFFMSAAGLANELTWGFRLPFEYTYGFAGVVALMLLFIAIVHWRQKERGSARCVNLNRRSSS
jgi:membrane protease YdiL (CAAX protease family)